MVNAVVSDGGIRPLEPLPIDWCEGQSLRVERADECERSVEEIDRDFAALASMCATIESADEEKMDRAIEESRRQAKEHVHRQMGLA